MRRILVVDDSDTARMFVKRCLEAIGFNEAEFLAAANGRQALECLRNGGVDLLVTDLTMPVMDGEELLRAMQESRRYLGTRIIVISSAGNMARKQELLALGALAVLAKPFAPTDLYKVLRAFIPEA